MIDSWPMFGPLDVPDVRPCLRCGEMMFDAGRNQKRHAECARRHNIERGMSLYEAAYSTGRVKQAMKWRHELVGYLRERDGDKCALCSKRVLFDVSTGPRGESDQGATVDHVIPRSHGGSNDLANLQLAHWACNRSKSNRGGVEQLRLVG
jgi:5-methylcytosine-specific restriction endonuclease McrA